MEDVQIALIRVSRKRLPDRAAEVGAPVARKLAVLVIPDIKIFAIFSVRIFARLFEPRMLIGAVVDDEIHEDIHIALLCLGNQLIHIVHRAEARVDIVIIGNIIALIRERRAVDRREPDDVDTELLEIIQFADNALQITDAVAVRVTEALRVNLIGYFFLPPFSFHLCIPPDFRAGSLYKDFRR